MKFMKAYANFHAIGSLIQKRQYETAILVASNGLGSRGVMGKSQISNKGTNCNRQHDHPVVCHEKKPNQRNDETRIPSKEAKREEKRPLT
jgi:hypothetical protein